MPGNAMPAWRGLGPATETYFLMSSASAGSFASGPAASIATVFRIPYRLIVSEPASDSNGNVIPRWPLKAARVSGGS